MFQAHVLIVRRSKSYYTASGIITPIGGRPLHRLREDTVLLVTAYATVHRVAVMYYGVILISSPYLTVVHYQTQR